MRWWLWPLAALLCVSAAERVAVVARRHKTLLRFAVDLNSTSAAEPELLFDEFNESYSTHFVVDVNKSRVAFVDGWSVEQHDNIQVFDLEKGSSSLRTIPRQNGIADEIISSQAMDWVTGKVYIAIDQAGSKKHGRIEACPIDSEFGCTVILSHEHAMHYLVVDPVEGYLYWLNKILDRVESAWMNGAFVERHTFSEHEDTTRAKAVELTLDATDRKLFYLRVWSDRCEIIGCKLHDRNSCHVVATPNDAFHLAVYKDKLFWSNLKGQLRFCLKKNCAQTMQSVYGIADIETFAFLHPNVQPQRVHPNPCADGNGGCSHFCLLIPGAPWRRCLCAAGAELQPDGRTCQRPSAFFVLSHANVTNDLLRLSMNPSLPHVEPLAVANIFSLPLVMALDSVRKWIYFVTEERFGRPTAIRRAPLTGGASESVLESPTLKDVRGMTVDPVTGTVFWSNGFLRRIEAVSPDGKKRRTLVWDDVDPHQLAFHPHLKRLFFVDGTRAAASIRSIAAPLVHAAPAILVKEVGSTGRLTGLALDPKKEQLFWSTQTDAGGAIYSVRVDGTAHRQEVGGEHVRPKILATYAGGLYFANAYNGTIDLLTGDGQLRTVQGGVGGIESFLVAFESNVSIVDPCASAAGNGREECFLASPATRCDDQFDFDAASQQCRAPRKFLLLGTKDRFVRYRIRPTTAGGSVLNQDPFVVLPIANIGQPVAVVFDSLSPNRFLYWIDAHDRVGGRIKRASDSVGGDTTHISLREDSNCSLLHDLAIDEVGRQLFISCAPQDSVDIASIHVWRILDDDRLKYLGKVVDGHRKSFATDSFPFPKQIAVFGRLNALFYADCSRLLGATPVIVRCYIDGRQCTTVVSRGVKCNNLRLEADLVLPRLVYTTVNGIWSRDVYVDGDLRQLVRFTRDHQHIVVAPLNDRSMVVVSANETLHGDRILELHYELSMRELNDLPEAAWAKASAQVLNKVTSLHVVGATAVDPGMLEITCLKSDCSHLCRVPYDPGSLGERKYECLCPLDYTLSLDSPLHCLRNFECRQWEFRCLNGRQCIHVARRCDGIPDCTDRSDELPGICPRRTPTSHEISAALLPMARSMWTCDAGKTTAIGLHQLCNGMPDCEDDSDERYCRCSAPVDEFDCSSWSGRSLADGDLDCVPRHLLCDGIPHCRNGADELPQLCRLLRPGPEGGSSVTDLLDASAWKPAYVIIAAGVLVALLLILAAVACVVCCCRQRTPKERFFFNDTSATLLSNQHTLMTNTASPQPMMHTRLLLPSGPQSQQVDIALRTYPTGSGGSDYGYIPATHAHPSSATLQLQHRLEPHVACNYNSLPWRAQHVPPTHFEPARPMVMIRSQTGSSAATSSVVLPNPHAAHEGVFYAPPPSAASLSTYGVVKPAGMKMAITPRNERRSRSGGRRDRILASGPNPCGSTARLQRDEQRLKEELMQFAAPPTYSEIGSALECSTPRSDRTPPRTKSGRHVRNSLQRRPASSSSPDSSSDDDLQRRRDRPLLNARRHASQEPPSSGSSPPAPPSNSSNTSSGNGVPH